MLKIKEVICLVSIILLPLAASANHGPGTTGGGSSTQSGETLKEDQFVFSFDETYTNYENVSTEEAEKRASKVGEFDSLSDAFFTNMSAGYGVTDDFQIEGSIGWYSGRRFIDAHKEEGEGHSEKTLMTEHKNGDEGHQEEESGTGASSAFGNPEGLTDLMIRGKYRVMKGENGHLSLIGGGVFPVGDDNERLSDGEKLEPSSQPGSGRYSVLGGIAYSKYLTPHITFDVSSLYVYRLKRDDFKVGDRVDMGMAVAYRLNKSISEFPQFSLFFEVLHQYIGKDENLGISNPNSGGSTLFFIPGVRATFTKNVGLMLAPSIPTAQNLNGDQLKTDFRILSSLFIRF